ncbi:hypothetical protein [Neptunomonas japonica]|uniref:hypothetical protein n=1 Tax=Neptunomonas japonica TaxID=417574 RepID=UPI0004120734|nr:hypothetical protein [Neptunomonas japonica]
MHTLLKSTLITSLLISSPLLFSGSLWAHDTLTQRWSIDNLDQPESVVADTRSDFLYISNINGAPTELNGQGYISKVTAQGELLEQHWVTGLNAPKGMAIVGKYLFVADMQTVHMIDIEQGNVIKQFTAPKAKMLNDITASADGVLYISDFLGGEIYQLHDNQLTAWFSNEQIPYPNGLLWHQNQLLIGNWGKAINPDFTTQTPGSLYQLDPSTLKLSSVASGTELGNLDGIVAINNSLYISDWISGELFELNGKERKLALTLPKGLADIGATATSLYTPLMMNNQVIAWEVKDQL